MFLDSMDRKVLGERLRVSRIASGKTQDEVAAHLNFARTTLVAIERGDRKLRSDELLTLASLYGVSVGSLLREPSIHVDLVAQFRKSPRSSEPTQVEHGEERLAVQLLHKLASGYVELEQRLERPLRTNYPAERQLGRGSLEEQAEDIALEMRALLGLGMSPIADLMTVLEMEIGLRIFVRKMASNIAGLFAYHSSLGGCVLLNGNHPKTRRTWTLAHEFAHFLTTRLAAEVCYVEPGGTKPPSERFADLFAAAFLMPRAVIRRAVADLGEKEGKVSVRQVLLMAHRFHVSVEAMCRRLETLGLLENGTYEMLRARGLSERHLQEVLGRSEDEAVEVPPRFAVLAIDACLKDLLSEGQLAEMLAVDRLEARRLIDVFDDGDFGA
jgi:Zn-dependent peptidase ImmA (M78 family)/DNA-binding XRE family transcriptional regulator